MACETSRTLGKRYAKGGKCLGADLVRVRRIIIIMIPIITIYMYI